MPPRRTGMHNNKPWRPNKLHKIKNSTRFHFYSHFNRSQVSLGIRCHPLIGVEHNDVKANQESPFDERNLGAGVKGVIDDQTENGAIYF